MKFLLILILTITLLTTAYCNIPLSNHTYIDIQIINSPKDNIQFSFLDGEGRRVADWEQAGKHFDWSNEEGYNLNGPDILVDDIINIKKFILTSKLCEPITIDINFSRSYIKQDYTKYFHHGSKAYIEYRFKDSVIMECNDKSLALE